MLNSTSTQHPSTPKAKTHTNDTTHGHMDSSLVKLALGLKLSVMMHRNKITSFRNQQMLPYFLENQNKPGKNGYEVEANLKFASTVSLSFV